MKQVFCSIKADSRCLSIILTISCFECVFYFIYYFYLNQGFGAAAFADQWHGSQSPDLNSTFIQTVNLFFVHFFKATIEGRRRKTKAKFDPVYK